MQSLYRNILNKFMFNYLRLYISDSLDVSSTLLYMYFELMCLSFYLSLGILDNVQFVWIDMKWLKDLILNKFLSNKLFFQFFWLSCFSSVWGMDEEASH